MSDRLGRKPALFTGLSVFLLGVALATIAQLFTLQLGARALQGLRHKRQQDALTMPVLWRSTKVLLDHPQSN